MDGPLCISPRLQRLPSQAGLTDSADLYPAFHLAGCPSPMQRQLRRVLGKKRAAARRRELFDAELAGLVSLAGPAPNKTLLELGARLQRVFSPSDDGDRLVGFVQQVLRGMPPSAPGAGSYFALSMEKGAR